MKRLYKLCSLLLVFATLLTCVSCAGTSGDVSLPDVDESAIVMRYGDYTLNEKEFMYIVSFMKNYYVSNQQAMYYQMTGQVYTETQILTMADDDGKLLAEYVKEAAVNLAQQLLIVEHLSAEAGITVTNQEDLDAIDEYLSDVEYAYGGEDLFEIALIRLGFARSGIERLQKIDLLTELVIENRYGENGTARIPGESVTDYFLENYICYDGGVFSYVDSDKAGYITYEYTDDEIVKYFEDNYVRVRHILYKANSANKETVKAEAEADLALLQSGEKKFDDLKSKNDDSGSEYVFTYGEMVEPFEKAAYEMNVGDIRLVESEFGYHIVEKLEKNNDVVIIKEDDDEKTVSEKEDTKKEVVVAMSKAKIKNEALQLKEKINNGEITELPKSVEGFSNYSLLEKTFTNKNDTTYAKRIEVIKALENDKCGEYDSPTEGISLYRRLSFTAEDITSTAYTEIESSLINKAFSDYISSYYDGVQLDNELLNKFDVLTIPMLEDEFYSAN